MAKRQVSPIPSDWADQLTVAETAGILEHWQGCVQYWSNLAHPQGLFEMPALPSASRHLAVVTERVSVWSEILDAKKLGLKVQHMLYSFRRDK